MTHSTTQPNLHPVDDSPLVVTRKPVAHLVDRDNDGKPDTYVYDLNHDGNPDVEHRLHDRRTFVTVQRAMPWEAPSSITLFTDGEDGVPLRVTFRVKPVSALCFEVNACAPVPTCPELHGMLSLGVVWDADREHRDELEAARCFWHANGGVGGFERL